MAGEAISNFVGSHHGSDRGDAGPCAETWTGGHKGRGVNGSRGEESNKRKWDAAGTGEGADQGGCRAKQRRLEGVAEEVIIHVTNPQICANSPVVNIIARR